MRTTVRFDGVRGLFVSGIRSINVGFPGLIDMISCHLFFDQSFESLLHPDGTTLEYHLFLCPLTTGPRHTLALPEFDHYYWAKDPEGDMRLSKEESDHLGLPRFKLRVYPWATFWEPYHYGAVREFHEGRGFNPGSQDMGLPLVKMQFEP